MNNLKTSIWQSKRYAVIVFITLAWALITHEETQKEQDPQEQEVVDILKVKQ